MWAALECGPPSVMSILLFVTMPVLTVIQFRVSKSDEVIY
jgi:hypothetical protein